MAFIADRSRAFRHSKLFVVAGVLLVANAVHAQATGNPKGTRAPAATEAEKAPASRAPTEAAGQTESGKIVTDPAQARARVRGTQPQSSAGAGGLSSTRDGDAAQNRMRNAKRNDGSVQRPAPQ